MPTTFCLYSPCQTMMMLPSFQNWIPDGHLVQNISDLVDGLELTALYPCYEGQVDDMRCTSQI